MTLHNNPQTMTFAWQTYLYIYKRTRAPAFIQQTNQTNKFIFASNI